MDGPLGNKSLKCSGNMISGPCHDLIQDVLFEWMRILNKTRIHVSYFYIQKRSFILISEGCSYIMKIIISNDIGIFYYW